MKMKLFVCSKKRNFSSSHLCLLLTSSFLLLCSEEVVVEGYDFRSVGFFYETIYDELTGDPIGGMWQDMVFDDSAGGERVGTMQGFAFNGVNCFNKILFLTSGELNIMNDIIVGGTGDYLHYTGGHIETTQIADNPEYIAENTLFEPPVPATNNDDGDVVDDDDDQFFITGQGGFYMPISNNNGTQIGQIFENPVWIIPNSTNSTSGDLQVQLQNDGDDDDAIVRIGTNQGYGFLFPNDTFILEELGITNLVDLILGSRRFAITTDVTTEEEDDDGGNNEEEEVLTIFNEVVVHSTGRYSKYQGTIIDEKILSPDPNFISSITLHQTASMDDGDDEAGSVVGGGNEDFDFRITAEGGFYEPILNPQQEQIGERFQNPVYDSNGNRIGTNQGYGINFDFDDNFTRPLAQGNRLFYLRDGQLNVFNEIIVHGSGIYSKYTGGMFKETILAYNPYFVSEISLTERPSQSSDSSNSTTTPESPSPSESTTTADPQQPTATAPPTGEEEEPTGSKDNDDESSSRRNKILGLLVATMMIVPVIHIATFI